MRFHYNSWPDRLAYLVSYRPVSETKISEWHLRSDRGVDLHPPSKGLCMCTVAHKQEHMKTVAPPESQPWWYCYFSELEPIGSSPGIFFCCRRKRNDSLWLHFQSLLPASWCEALKVGCGSDTEVAKLEGTPWVGFKDTTEWWSEKVWDVSS